MVAEKLSMDINCTVITVGGTNGKGSTVAGLDAIYRVAGYRVGTFNSPVLFRHNEYVKVNGREATDELFGEAYKQIVDVKGEVALTPFEFHALAALWIFAQSKLDVIILEVGLGGRLDAVNIMDADVSIVTSIAIDHADWLGDTREKIAYEKAGIFRSAKPAICGDRHPPSTLTEHAKKIGAKLFCIGKEFDYVEEEGSWNFITTISPLEKGIFNLPLNSLYLQNMSCALMAITLLQEILPVSNEAIVTGLKNIILPGRVQIIAGKVIEIYDVAHNPAAVAYLAKRLKEIPSKGKTIAIFSMLADKDIRESVKQIASEIDEWHVAQLNVKRAATKEQLLQAFDSVDKTKIYWHITLEAGYRMAKANAKAGDRLVIFGSFHTVSSLMNKEIT